MGKEAKIGLTVITLLLVAFGVVLANRLKESDGRPPKSTAKQEAPNTAASKTRDVPVAKTVDPGRSAAGKTTIVAAKAVIDRSPKNAAQQWSVTSDDADVRQVGSKAAKASLPSFMPKPSGASAAEYHRRYGRNIAPSPAAKPWQQTDAAVAQLAADPAPSDPFRNRTQQMSIAEQSVAQSPSQVSVLNPPPQSPRQSADGGYRSAYSPTSRYKADNPAVQQVPAYQQRSPYSRTRSAQPKPYRGATSRSASKYSGRDLRRKDGTYVVEPNDNFWVISEKLYGSGAYFKALAEHNRPKVPREEQLAVGDVISAPDIKELEETYPGYCPRPSRRETVKKRAANTYAVSQYSTGRTYTVEEGDTLFDIARYELGKASRWVEIHELNRSVLGKDFDYLTPGLQLVLPRSEAADTVTQRSNAELSRYRR